MPRPAVFKNAKRINLTLDEEILKKTREIAKETDRTVSEVVRDVLKAYLDGSLIQRRERLSEVVKRIHKMRESLPPSKTDSAKIIRAWRDAR